MLVHAWLSAYEAAEPGCEAGCNGRGRRNSRSKFCDSSATYDFGPKLALYRHAGVQEYITVSLNPARVVWRHLEDGSYKTLRAGDDGLVRSLVFPGLWLDPAALLAEDSARVLEALRAGLDSVKAGGRARGGKPKR
ncbi:MAG: Uma2 family endonuclease [Bryobacteraceae bacterium]